MKKSLVLLVAGLALSLGAHAAPTRMSDAELDQVVAGFTVVKTEQTGETRYVGGPNQKIQYEYKITTGTDCTNRNGLGTCESIAVTYEWRNR